MDLNNETKSHIDNIPLWNLKYFRRHKEESDPWFHGETKEYWDKRITELESRTDKRIRIEREHNIETTPEPLKDPNEMNRDELIDLMGKVAHVAVWSDELINFFPVDKRKAIEAVRFIREDRFSELIDGKLHLKNHLKDISSSILYIGAR